MPSPDRPPVEPRASLTQVSVLLFGSGFCALVYQVAWLRELRLIFGASTAASAAVLAIFMGGLGLGGLRLGPRADRHARPLFLYGQLELLVAATAAVTPALVAIARAAYTALGGTVVMGLGAGTAVRVVLAALVLAAPTVLMGGTLPAAAKAVETDDDAGRRSLAALYGANTLGAVTGAAVSTFLLLEVFGTRISLWMACLVNALIGLAARAVARSLPPRKRVEEEAEAGEEKVDTSAAPPRFVLVAAGIVGFAFLLMELVWYRMLAPLLGGLSYTFGLILAIALLGIGLGGGAYAVLGKGRPATLRAFALTCGLEAVLLAIPYALGDRIAVLAVLLRPLGSAGFYGHVAGWTIIASILVLPAAVVSGFQFPLLIGLLGRGGAHVGRHVGVAYASNTAGAIVGSLAGGFGLLPLLGALGAWRAAVITLALLGAAALVIEARSGTRRLLPLLLPAAAALLVVPLLRARGPTAAWRHSPIGAGRADEVAYSASKNSVESWARDQRRAVKWEKEGVESSVGASGPSFIVNGKIDGNARTDASTQVMSALVGAILHQDPKRALVVGLGTGSTAGWLGAIPSMERVDVVELEPAILAFARTCGPVNQNAMDNPRVHTFIGDAREVLLTTRSRYDLIFSEPSNPYRAGISSLFTQEFYRAAAARLDEGGVFMQWIQAYEIDPQGLRTAYATLASVFPSIETWRTGRGDLLLLAGRQPSRFDAARLRARIREEPFRSALANTWRTDDLEGFLARYVARPELARAIAQQEGPLAINTDDLNRLEFAFARNVGRSRPFGIDDILDTARRRGELRPEVLGEIDWIALEDQRASMHLVNERPPSGIPQDLEPEQLARFQAGAAFAASNMHAAVRAWRSQPRAASRPLEVEVMAEALVDIGDAEAPAMIERLRAFQPTEADALLGRLRMREGKAAEAADALLSALTRYRADPWPSTNLMSRAIDACRELARRDKAFARRLYEVLREPFVLHMFEGQRRTTLMELAGSIDFPKRCSEALTPLEPDFPWQKDALVLRLRCYDATLDPRLPRARSDLEAFLDAEGAPFQEGLVEIAP